MNFRFCKHCGKIWPDRESFLADSELSLSGCQVETDDPARSLVLFDHRAPNCGTTLAVEVNAFDDLYDGPRHKVNWAPSAKCYGMCFDPEDLSTCPAECRNAYVREILKILREAVAGK